LFSLPAAAAFLNLFFSRFISCSTDVTVDAPVSLRRSFWHDSLIAQLSPLIPDQSDDHAVEVEEEHKQVETKLDERLLLVHVELPKDLRGVKQVLVLEDPVS
jgi:hypothetical protein